MRSRKIQACVGTVITAGALAFAASPAHAWTYQDCVDVNFDHPDCIQYQTTTTTEAPTTTTTEAPTSTSTTTMPSTSTTVKTATSTTSTTSQPSATSTVKPTVQIGTAVTIAAPPAELPHTGSSTLPLGVAGFVLLIAGAGALAYARRKAVAR